ncbi:Aste57867_23089 [Aphanomyces stellatus]|uniref:Aste57867_23089 protein n=1 Tax=Aphanomyces stellatus TaxID=120398 RepID=A0A485LM95_9STRA|nr:hypothetical protein As57867_023018 [Aphanomyces stellatus]VFT99737.1 Aste57867_23089 [Aphanomyces stellatus]
MLPPTRLAAITIAAVAAVSHAAKYPAYCAKDMDANKVQPLKDPKNLELIQVQLVVRHGARTPWSANRCWDGYNEEWNCSIRQLQRPELKVETANKTLVNSREFEKVYVRGDNVFPGTCNLGQMIDEGYYQQALNGQHLRDAYVGPHGLFQTTDNLVFTNATDIYFESSDIPRTINSGMIIIDTLFPRATNESSKPAVPWHTGDYSHNFVTPNPVLCPKLNWIDQAWRQSSDYQGWLHSAENHQLELDLQKVVRNYDHATLYDCFMTAKCTDRALPAGIDDDLFARTTSREESFQIQQYLYNHSAYARAGMSPLIQRIRTRAILAVAHRAPRFVMTAAHDTTIMPLLGALGGSAWLTEWVPYASHMLFEVYTNKTDYFVRILYQGKPLAIPGCTTEVCPFKAFLDLTEFANDASICRTPAKPFQAPVAVKVGEASDATSSTTTWTWLYVIGGVVAGTALGYFAASNVHANRQGYSSLPERA